MLEGSDRRRSRRFLTCVLAVLAGRATLAAAQTPVVGRVVSNGRGVAQADIVFEPSGLRVTSADSGTFSLLVPTSGLYRIAVRAVGFHPTERRLLIAGSDTVSLVFDLLPSPQRLDSIVVRAPEPVVSGKMQAFEERRRMGFGRFYTRADLAKRESSPISNVIRMTAGLDLVRRPHDCGGGFSVATSRGGQTRRMPWMSCYNGIPFPTACYLAVYLDGTRIWAPGSQEPADVDQFLVLELEGIEIYRGPSETPAQYQGTGAACGAILLWTRVGDR